MQRITSALFLDFDNIFSGLLDLDREAALALAEHPDELIHELTTHGMHDGVRRDLLVRRAYLNPTGIVRDKELGNDQGILYLNRFRPHLVRAGFEVIDCPALTMRQKNAADIRIVIDVLGALESPVRYDEIIVASSDSDFTPLLLKLRANDRRTTIITAGTLAPAYQAVADTYIDEQQLIALLLPSIASTVDEPGDTHDGLESVAAPTTASPAGEPPQMDAPVSAASPTLEQPATTEAAHNTTLEAVQAPPTTAPATKAVNKATAAKKAASSAVPAKDSAALDNAKHRAHSKLSQLLADSDSPLNLATVASAIHTLVGTEVISDTKWFGEKTFSGFVQSCSPKYQVSTHLVWDTSRHAGPGGTRAQRSAAPVLPKLITEVCAATDMARIPSAAWAATFDVLAEYAATHTFALTEATIWSRDQLKERGHIVGRSNLSAIIRACLFAGAHFDSDPPPDASALREAFAGSTIERARSAGFELSSDDAALLRRWLSGDG